MPLRPKRSGGEDYPAAVSKLPPHLLSALDRRAVGSVCPLPENREFGLRDDTSRNHGSVDEDVFHSAR